jgi:hypothetical protein
MINSVSHEKTLCNMPLAPFRLACFIVDVPQEDHLLAERASQSHHLHTK